MFTPTMDPGTFRSSSCQGGRSTGSDLIFLREYEDDLGKYFFPSKT